MTPLSPLGPRHPLVVGPALVAPILLLVAGVLRIVDGIDGEYGGGPAWDLSYATLLFACVVLAVLVGGLARSVPPITGTGRGVTEVAVAVGLLGAGALAWFTLGHLYDEVAASGSLARIGASLLTVSVVTLLVLLVGARALPWWSPAAVLAGAVVVAWHVELVPLGASLVLVGLAPLASLRLPLPTRTPFAQR